MDLRPPGDPLYTQVPTQGPSPNHIPMPPPPPYPNEPPPKYEPPKGPQYQPQGANYPPGPFQQPYYATTTDSYQQGPPIVSQPVFVVHQVGFGANPREMECPYCHAYVRTSTEYQTGALTWLVSGLLCLFGCWMGCCLLPFCIEDMQDVLHRCPNCNKNVGVCRRLI